jgi:Putative zinc-finger
MCDKDLLVGYVYDDISDMDRARFERHLRECAACRGEVSAMRGVRDDLATWVPPQPDLGFQITQVRRPSLRTWWTPALGLAAAAVIVLAAALAVANVEVSYGANGLSLRTGWARGGSDTGARLGVGEREGVGVRADAVLPAAQITPAVLTAMDRRLTVLETAIRSAAISSSPRASDTDILRRVRDLLAQSESRQQQELALRIAQVIRDVDAQRLADLSRIQQGLGRIDAMTTAEAAAHRDLANYILTSSRAQQK